MKRSQPDFVKLGYIAICGEHARGGYKTYYRSEEVDAFFNSLQFKAPAITASQVAFEDYAKQRHMDLYQPYGHYQCRLTYEAWTAWQAALAPKYNPSDFDLDTSG